MNPPASVAQKKNFIAVFILGLVVLFAPVCFILLQVLNYTHGTFMYPYDDTFIHLTIADNLIHKHNWGINGNEFASASSSILYTLILAFVRLFSTSVMVPFIVNCAAGIAILITIQVWLRKERIYFPGQGVIISTVIFITPLPLLIISGMEHTLQCLFSFLFIFYFSDWLGKTKSLKNEKIPLKIFLFSVLTTAIRYEGLFLIAIACCLLLAYKKIYQGFILGAVAVLPVVLFGIVSLSKGNYFLPNSVLVKSGSFDFTPFQFAYNIIFDKLVYAKNGMAALATQRLIIAIPLLYFLFKKYLKPSYFFVLIFLFVAAILQLSFASTGYLYRYEAYLFLSFTVIFLVLFYQYGKYIFTELDSLFSKFIAFALAFFLFFPVVLRSATALEKAAQGCKNIYDQQFQMAIFTKKYYNKSNIALNDIGAVSYFTKARIADLWGLANIEVTRSKKEHSWTPDFLDSLCRQKKVELAIIYDSWFSDSLTKKWDKVATWQIQNNVICGDSIVSFYSLKPFSKDLLKQRLKQFEPQLPPTVGVKYY